MHPHSPPESVSSSPRVKAERKHSTVLSSIPYPTNTLSLLQALSPLLPTTRRYPDLLPFLLLPLPHTLWSDYPA